MPNFGFSSFFLFKKRAIICLYSDLCFSREYALRSQVRVPLYCQLSQDVTVSQELVKCYTSIISL